MVKTIGNPLSWGGATLSQAGHALETAAENIGSHDSVLPEIRPLTLADIRMALDKGINDFAHFRSDVFVMVLIYPAIGILLAFAAFQQNLLHLIFPMAAGFALIGPFVAIGLYELSRRREAGETVSWAQAITVFRPAVAGPVFALGLYLMALYAIWLVAAAWIYQITLGPDLPATLRGFATEVMTTSEGYAMMTLGLATGLVFALLVLITGLISFPMLIDRRVGVPVAVAASFRLARQSPRVVGFWGLTVAAILVAASIPVFLGLILALPILGHTTWHLYRAAVRFPD
ncbi:putative integral membrane protein [Thalassovita gelatinovora]|uniref:Putative integral membrane protein n=1 Tax=Thalassovita gelatinovora TaxID=53501 RepID=A0A0P1F5X1_THAGE|nr:DUF2189 domain-containing protein [Thalassovita gelatinovora]QIZ80783.1 DUF2189 domain-containing protein [Thalassovita gelatinovora]CUH63160.1 putative integral membrane protein [Thalassovita gelatinovora]SEQ62748.1 Uncharacterized membrane protein [Thalassovita gelatinovora]